MPEATTEMKIFIAIANATKDDIEYATKLQMNPGNIKQADLRDNMQIIEPDKEQGWRIVLRSAKLEREYQEWQEEVRKKLEKASNDSRRGHERTMQLIEKMKEGVDNAKTK